MSQRGYHTAERGGRRRAASVLVADDDPTSRMLVGAALEGHVGEVVEAENGRCAGRGARAANSFDLAIVDLDMPVMDGFGVIERARARAETRHLPIIVVTGRDDVVAIERAFALGATSFLCKPINWNVFRHQVALRAEGGAREREMRASPRSGPSASPRSASAYARGAGEGDRRRGRRDLRVRRRLGSHGRPGGARRARDCRRAAVGGAAPACVASPTSSPATAVLERERVRAADVAAEAVRRTADALGVDAAARIELGGAVDRELFCDRRLAAVALSEVLQNALAYSPADEKVQLTVVEAPPDRIRFEIEDRGPGIPEHMLTAGSRLRPSGRTSSPRPGSASRWRSMIAERHGGHLGIMSETGRGSEVFLSFPASASRPRVTKPERDRYKFRERSWRDLHTFPVAKSTKQLSRCGVSAIQRPMGEAAFDDADSYSRSEIGRTRRARRRMLPRGSRLRRPACTRGNRSSRR